MTARPLEIYTYAVGAMRANCYLLVDPYTKDTLVIDPGDDASYISSEIERMTLTPRAIIASHGHVDHIMGVTDLSISFSLPFFLHRDDEFLVHGMRDSARHFLHIESGPPPHVDKHLDTRDPILIGKGRFQVIHTPGHTPGSVCLYDEALRILFSGDTLFAQGSVGRTDFSYSDPTALQQHLKQLLDFPEDVMIYPGHGPSSTIGDERLFHYVKHDIVTI